MVFFVSFTNQGFARRSLANLPPWRGHCQDDEDHRWMLLVSAVTVGCLGSLGILTINELSNPEFHGPYTHILEGMFLSEFFQNHFLWSVERLRYPELRLFWGGIPLLNRRNLSLRGTHRGPPSSYSFTKPPFGVTLPGGNRSRWIFAGIHGLSSHHTCVLCPQISFVLKVKRVKDPKNSQTHRAKIC